MQIITSNQRPSLHCSSNCTGISQILVVSSLAVKRRLKTYFIKVSWKYIAKAEMGAEEAGGRSVGAGQEQAHFQGRLWSLPCLPGEKQVTSGPVQRTQGSEVHSSCLLPEPALFVLWTQFPSVGQGGWVSCGLKASSILDGLLQHRDLHCVSVDSSGGQDCQLDPRLGLPSLLSARRTHNA